MADTARQRSLHDDLADLELRLELTDAIGGRRSPWIDRLRDRVRELRQRRAGGSDPAAVGRRR